MSNPSDLPSILEEEEVENVHEVGGKKIKYKTTYIHTIFFF